MSKMIQIRDVPEELHGTLKARAAREGMSLSDYLKRELQRTVARPTMGEWLDRVGSFKPVGARQSSARMIREVRESR